MNPFAPVANLLVIRSPDIHRAVEFYRCIGMTFDRHSHGNGPEHYASDLGGFVLEIYPQRKPDESTARTRFGFNVADVDSVVDRLRELKVTITTPPDDTERGRRAVV